MKPKYEQVPLIKSLYNIKKEFFYNVHVPWHIHLEYELVFIRMEAISAASAAWKSCCWGRTCPTTGW